ncbi:MAG: PDDEXK nuclease domain-containing protein, partial [Bacteroidia bacterium]|nr:PDDEXK nuclease domain-containing protein [Bacteroidia bacterium]
MFSQIKAVLDEARTKISRSVNSAMVQAYWNVGKYIVEYEQKGEQRAEYGKNVINGLSVRLMKEYGSGFTTSNLKYMRQFYLCFPISHAVRDQLTWTHYRAIIKVQNEKARQFYLDESIHENWSTRQLERQINTLFYERLLASNDKEAVRKEIKQKETLPSKPREMIRDPYILEFIGIPQGEHFLENDLEQILIKRLQHFLLEMGKGFSFIARQKRISFDNQHFYIDLVFYNYLARCFVLIELKADHLTHADLG